MTVYGVHVALIRKKYFIVRCPHISKPFLYVKVYNKYTTSIFDLAQQLEFLVFLTSTPRKA